MIRVRAKVILQTPIVGLVWDTGYAVDVTEDRGETPRELLASGCPRCAAAAAREAGLGEIAPVWWRPMLWVHPLPFVQVEVEYRTRPVPACEYGRCER